MNTSLPLRDIKGVGEKSDAGFERAGLQTVHDLITRLPRRFDDYTESVKIEDLVPGQVSITARIESCNSRQVRRGLTLTTAVLADDTSRVKAIWFNQGYRSKQLIPGNWFKFSGNFEFNYNAYQLTNPSVEKAEQPSEKLPVDDSENQDIIPVYRRIQDVKPQLVKQILKSVRPMMAMLPETLPKSVLSPAKLLGRGESYLAIHFPKTREDVDLAMRRFGFEELFELLLASKLNKMANQKLKGYKIPFDVDAVRSFVSSLPFELTNAQRRAAWQLFQDFESEVPMNRLLQGDVGSGKTVVAGLGALQASHAGFQTALMAPTEILASQHAQSLRGLLEPFGIEVALLTGRVKGEARKQVYASIESGAAQVVVGTHALIQDKVEFSRLGFVVIDEQHRFGVAQRQKLLDKSDYMPHLLAMTATPIPRSLALTVYGELDISVLDELPKGRKPIKTKIYAPTSIDTLYEIVDKELEAGRQAYIICTLIDDNPENDTKSVEAEYRKLRSTIFRHRKVDMLHGKMKSEEKEEVMNRFSRHETDILISTTVVEVGVDVPNSTVIVIENADRFGLSQLHQLRGRVGRSSYQSYCYLVMSDSSKPSQRLKEVEKSNDGFYLAEVDLKLRGPGEIYGTGQHGALNLQVASITDTKLIAEVQSSVDSFIQSGEDLLQYKQLSNNVEKYQRLTTLN